MNAQRTIAGMMILGSSLLVAWASGDIAFPAILCMLGMVGLQGRFTWGIRPERRYITPLLLLLLAVLFSIQCEFAHPPSDEIASFAWQTIARYFLASMILILFLRLREVPQPPDFGTDLSQRRLVPLSPALGLFHLGSAMACGQVMLLDDQYLAFRLVELGGVTMVVLYALYAVWTPWPAPGLARDERRPRLSPRVSCVVLLVVAVNLGWVGGSMLYSRIQSLNLLPNWLWRSNMPLDASAGAAQVGFSNSGRLSGMLTIMEDPNPDPVLKITSDATPGYLRAVGFEKYTRLGWENLSPPGVVWGDRGGLLGQTYSFRLSDKESNREMTVRHVAVVTDAMFTPLGTCAIEAPFETLSRDEDDGAVRPPGRMRGTPTYHVAYTTSLKGNAPSRDLIRRMLGTPPQLHPRIRQLATRVFRNCNTSEEKIEAVTRYFHANYTYALGLAVPPDEDPLTYFLLEASTGYCEYFASGAAILLRLADVPTRYVTGFLVTEPDEGGRSSWVARNMNAHAWVEAWDQENETWVIVEATSQEDLASNAAGDHWRVNELGSRLLIARLIQAVYDYGLLGLLGWGWIFDFYSLHTAVALSLALLGAAVSLALMRRQRRRLSLTGRRTAATAELLALHKMLAAVDRKVRSAGVRRQPHETLHAFADRIRPGPQSEGDDGRFADWYVRYAGLRYCPSVSREHIDELRRLAQELRGKS